VIILAAVTASLSGCGGLPGQIASSQMIDQVAPTEQAVGEISNDPSPLVDEVVMTSLQQFPPPDLIIEGTIASEQKLWIPDTTASKAELADRQARGLPIGVNATDYQVTIDKVLYGQAPSTTLIIAPNGAQYKVGDRALLFLTDISGDPIRAPGQTKYMVMVSDGQFRIEKDNTLSSHRPKSGYPLADTYRGKDKGTLEKELQLIRQRLDSIEEVLAEEMTEDDKRALEEALKEHREGKTVPFKKSKASKH